MFESDMGKRGPVPGVQWRISTTSNVNECCKIFPASVAFILGCIYKRLEQFCSIWIRSTLAQVAWIMLGWLGLGTTLELHSSKLEHFHKFRTQ